MTQILTPLTSKRDRRVPCSYRNNTSQIQIIRIMNIPNWYFERAVLPGQRLLFKTLPEARLEIYTGTIASALLSDRVPCDQLQINDTTHSINVRT